jgi:hypothetical protein
VWWPELVKFGELLALVGRAVVSISRCRDSVWFVVRCIGAEACSMVFFSFFSIKHLYVCHMRLLPAFAVVSLVGC